MSTQLLATLVLIPIVGFIGSLLVPKRLERTIFAVAISTMLLEFASLALVIYQWLGADTSWLSADLGTLFASQSYSFSLELYFDKLVVVFLGMATVMTALVFFFSKYYMHREPGFKRFYSTVLLFFIGLVLIILAGNLEVLFVGWEFIGISSILLIAFYRDRFLPARNALKVFSVYRIADAFLLAAILSVHHYLGQHVNFAEISDVVSQHSEGIVLIGLLLFAAGAIKSAQFPFSYWLPRAMEGPTTSSAIFYGALSIHMGLFLLLRTYPIWEDNMWLRVAIAVLGLTTAIVATSITRVQSSIKTQIAYASITQIGIMFIELALGLQWLVLLHFVSNASLRTYQLLISPSAVSYLVHDQFFSFVPPPQKIKGTVLGKVRAAFYVLGIKEWNMNTAASHYLWAPFKFIGRACAALDRVQVQAVSVVLLLGLAVVAVPAGLAYLSPTTAILGIIFYIRAYTTKNSAMTGWNLIMLGHLFSTLSLVLASTGGWQYVVTYGAWLALAFVVGHACLRYARDKGQPDDLGDYHGTMSVFTKLGSVFFIVCLVFMVFPISPSFLAQEALLSSTEGSHGLQTVLFCLSYLLVGVSIMRLYTKVFFGPHKANSHEVAYKSS
ncbi:MAG TPA: proton-conducting transporter membrane subunit [Candidatus Saccharimonadales bacterium]|nr:proton-conducting transporter membrane subunit [Candidatus Saccharimonadales bacterium]